MTIRTRESSKLMRIPVSTGLVSSREYDRETFSTVSTSDSPDILKVPSSAKLGQLRIVVGRVGPDAVLVLPGRQPDRPSRGVVLEREAARQATTSRCR